MDNINDTRARSFLGSRWDLRDQKHVSDFNMKLDMAGITQGFSVVNLDLNESRRIYIEGNNTKGRPLPRIFFRIVDVKVCLVNLRSCIREIQINWHRIDTLTCLRFSRLWFEFVCLYRAFYEKYMLLVVDAGWPDQLDALDSAKKKNKKFYEIILGQDTAFVADGVFMNIPKDFALSCKEFIDHISSHYRTPEVHGSGKANKWIFGDFGDIEEAEYRRIQDQMNSMGQFLHILGVVACGRKYAEAIDLRNKKGKGES